MKPAPIQVFSLLKVAFIMQIIDELALTAGLPRSPKQTYELESKLGAEHCPIYKNSQTGEIGLSSISGDGYATTLPVERDLHLKDFLSDIDLGLFQLPSNFCEITYLAKQISVKDLSVWKTKSLQQVKAMEAQLCIAELLYCYLAVESWEIGSLCHGYDKSTLKKSELHRFSLKNDSRDRKKQRSASTSEAEQPDTSSYQPNSIAPPWITETALNELSIRSMVCLTEWSDLLKRFSRRERSILSQATIFCRNIADPWSFKGYFAVFDLLRHPQIMYSVNQLKCSDRAKIEEGRFINGSAIVDSLHLKESVPDPKIISRKIKLDRLSKNKDDVYEVIKSGIFSQAGLIKTNTVYEVLNEPHALSEHVVSLYALWEASLKHG